MAADGLNGACAGKLSQVKKKSGTPGKTQQKLSTDLSST